MDTEFVALLQAIKSCRLCGEYLPLGANPVLIARPTARLLIVGQAPGRRVHATGLPFNDPSGDRLRNWLGIDRETFYHSPHIAIVPMGFCYPGTGKGGDLPPRPECAAAWRRQLLERMPEVGLTLLFGQYAQAWHLGGRRKKSLTETVRAWREYWPQYLPLPHPSPRNIRWFKQNPWVEEEIVPLLRERVSKVLAEE
ncbi:uracil-DNA glycosylase family protein [Candidatus Thiothrix sp. Deng01]|uniref:Uracil-DNA glycosylase family protein n=1 Tax=Candidatus Thiothrix phosphatis TaxID=3112415 RepID=A0ABU6CSA8_9GAMM|nr:uracil-DNA glycosylase family protein [Candidatus Thiothrix sp. Deng01]MEB4589711.1 uracil-DNA glycosylase family protein [Candidatus Thiothrix sp. Deng01]